MTRVYVCAAVVILGLSLGCGREFSRSPLAPTTAAPLNISSSAGGPVIAWQSGVGAASVAPDNHLPGPSGFAFLVSGSTVTLGWQAAPGNVSQYLIEAGSASGLANLATFLTGSPSTLATVTGVPPGVYFARVRAVVDGALTAASNEIVVAVGGACIPSVSPISTHVPRTGGTVTLAVTASCAWTATSHSPFITVLSGASGSGNGVVVVAVAPNTGAQRSGGVTVAGQLVTIAQGAGNIHVGFDLFDPATQGTATTECRINGNPSRCVLRSNSFTFGTTTLTTYVWTVEYTYGGQVKTHSQTSSSPEFSFTDVCGLTSSSADGAPQPLAVSLVVTDSLGNSAIATSGAHGQPALQLRLYTCP